MTVAPVAEQYETILILDFGSQYTHLIARRIREFGVYCELMACNISLKDLHFKPKGVVLSGGPYSVYADGAPHVDPAVYALRVPVLGICYGLQEIVFGRGSKVISCEKKEFGKQTVNVTSTSRLFKGLDHELTVWMSHGDQVYTLPTGFKTVASTDTAPFAAIENESEKIYGIQFHPEVTHTPQGGKLLQNFVIDICGLKEGGWTMSTFIDNEIERIKKQVGPTGQVIGAVSGGVDSTIAAKLMSLAIGDRFHAILVDNGVMRQDECALAKIALQEGLGINLTVSNAGELFLGRLKGIKDPEQKRKIIGNTFIEVFEAEALKIEAQVGQQGKSKIEFLLQGTLYPDVIESISFKGPSATIKTHHNVGGLLENMKLTVIEPLRELFKDEVRALGQILKIDEELIWRHPFPG
jgi:GMP synthase (glutamine-hydrolysing)